MVESLRGKDARRLGMHLVRVRMTICAALRLRRESTSLEEDARLYGPCAGLHGHNFDVEVAVAGRRDAGTGMVVDFSALERIVRAEVFDQVDHRDLNEDVPWLRGEVPTSETLAEKFWERVEGRVRVECGVELYSVTVGERDTNIVTYFGPRAEVAFPPLAAGPGGGGQDYL